MAELRKILRYPCVLLLGILLIAITIADILKPDTKMSELENRVLKQAPAFNLSTLSSNRWTREYDEYTREQFVMRDDWMLLHSFLEQSLQKVELGGVWLAKDGFLMAKTSVSGTSEQRVLKTNTQAVCSLAERYPGRVHVMIVPSASNIMADYLPADPPRLDENAALDAAFTQFRKAGINVIDLRDEFSRHFDSGEQLYYRTDHHWTTDSGAFLAYKLYCRAVGREAVDPPEKIKVSVNGFLGTNYAKALNVGVKADQLIYYDFPNPITIEKREPDGSTVIQSATLMAYDKLETYDKYSAFLHGINGYSHIDGDGYGSVVIIKDSYGNSFVPFLIQNYKDIEVIDLRDRRDIDDLVDIDSDILVLYSFSIFTQDVNLTWLSYNSS